MPFPALNPGSALFTALLSAALVPGIPLAQAAPAADSTRAGTAPDTVRELPDAMVTATRTYRKASEVPRAVNLVGFRTLGERMPRNSAEALREETGIAVQKTEHGGGNAIIRGLGSNQVLLLVDGVRLNNSTYRFGNHPYLTTVDNHMLDRLEVVRGPGSVLYGSDAMGGTVNLVTRNAPVGVDGGGLSAQGRGYARFASADEEKILRADGAMQGPGFGLSAGATLRETGDLRRGESGGDAWLRRSDAAQGPSGYRGEDYDAKLSWEPVSRHRLTLAWQKTARPEVPRFDRYENDGFHRWVYTPQERDLAYLTWEHRDGAVPLRAFASWQRQEEGREMQKQPAGVETREWGETRTLGAGLQAGHTLQRHAFSLGLDAYLDHVASHRNTVDPATGATTRQILALYPDGGYYGSYGIFLQDEVKLGSAWTATVGARYSVFRMDFMVPYDPALAFPWSRVDETFHAFTGSLGISRRLAQGIHLNANLGQGFRAPNLSDVAKTGESKGDAYEIPNPDLAPEDILSMDAGIKVDRERVKAAFFLHHAEISDLVASAPTTYQGSPTYSLNGQAYQLRSKQNIGEAFIRGLESELLVRTWSKLWLRGNYAYAYGKNVTADEPVGGIPPGMGLAGLKWADPAFAVEAFARFAQEQDRLSADDLADPRIQPGGTPGWVTWNLRGDWRVYHSLRLVLGLENLADLNYREHGSGINAPGRNLTGGFDWYL